MKLREDFLHYLWRMKLFNLEDLKTVEDVPIEIIEFGEYNTNAGPDFLNARIKIGDTLWAGNVEMHIKSSEWLKHKHQDDKAYDNVILHVVYQNDQDIQRENGEKIAALEGDIEEVKKNIASITDYAVAYFKELKRKYLPPMDKSWRYHQNVCSDRLLTPHPARNGIRRFPRISHHPTRLFQL